MKTNQRHFFLGVKTTAPVLLGIVPFAMISGITAFDSGISLVLALFMSVFIFAGASQLATLQLLSAGASSLVIVYTAIIINLRFMMYSLSLSPFFQHMPLRWKALLSYFIVDKNYALSIAHYTDYPEQDPRWFYLGSSIILWVVWQAATLTGYLMGTIIPPQLGLDFAIPLSFIAVLFKTIDRPSIVAAIVVSAIVSVTARSIPLNLGLVLAAMAGIITGLIVESSFESGKGGSEK